MNLDVGQALDQGAWTTYQKILLSFVFLALVIDGVANQSLSVAMPVLMRFWSLPKSAFASVAALGQTGLLIGALVGGALADHLGRRKILVGSILIFSLATLALSRAPDLTVFGLLRLVDGFGIGAAIPTGAALVSDFTPVRWRSRAIAIALVSIPIGNLSGGLIGSTVLPTFGWRALFAINGLFGLAVGTLLLIVLPESPQFLSRRPGHRAQLLRILRRLGVPAAENANFIDTETPHIRGRTLDLFASSLRLSTVGVFGGFFFVFIAVYTLLGWVPTLLAGHHFSLRITSLSLSAYSSGGILGALFAAKLIEMRGSRFAFLLLACGAMSVAMILAFTTLDAAQPAFVLAGLASEGLMLNGLTTCLYAMAAHIFPPAIRSTGIGGASALGRVGAVFSAYAAVAALEYGARAFFLLVAAMIAFGMLSLLSIVLQIERIPNSRVASS